MGIVLIWTGNMHVEKKTPPQNNLSWTGKKTTAWVKNWAEQQSVGLENTHTWTE